MGLCKTVRENKEKRAVTTAQKRKILLRILYAWLSVPDLRLGQLLSSALLEGPNGQQADMFNIEDADLARRVERHVRWLLSQKHDTDE